MIAKGSVRAFDKAIKTVVVRIKRSFFTTPTNPSLMQVSDHDDGSDEIFDDSQLSKKSNWEQKVSYDCFTKTN